MVLFLHDADHFMIKANDILFSYGGKPVFDFANFTVGTNQRVGLVGLNGSGKSTLFKLILKKEELLDGDFTILGNVGYVPQEVKRDENLENAINIRGYIDPDALHKDHELVRILKGLELENLKLDAKSKKLSGGQKTKLALTRALIEEPDILLLDEPTNFMDVNGRAFVMNFLSTYSKTLFVVSHDLELLGEHIDKIMEIDIHTRKINEYKGDYKKYLKLKEEKENLLKKTHKVGVAQISQMEAGLRKHKLSSGKGVRKRIIMQRRIQKQKESLPELPRELKHFKLNLPEPQRGGELPIKLTNISKSYGNNKILNNINLTIYRNEKFLLIGPNGSGKSTIIKIIMKSIEPDVGNVIEGDNLKVGYYSQEFENFDMDATVLDFIVDEGDVNEVRARGYLGKFLFDSQKLKQKIGTLSGGEKTRLSIALTMLENNNLLILDEPTTYLDPMSQRIILEAIKEYKGTLILVSHVVDFVKEIKPDRAILMPEAKIVTWDDSILDKVDEA